MASSLLESLVGLVSPSLVSRTAAQLGESEGSVAAGMNASFSTILGGLLSKATDSGTMQQVAGLIGSQDAAAADPNAMTITTVAPTGGSLLSTLFGGKASGVADLIAHHSGLKPTSATSLLSMAAPLVLGELGNRTGGGNPVNLASTLLTQKDSILGALPGGLGSMLGLAGIGDLANGARSKFSEPVVASTIPRATTPVASSSNRWMMPLLGVIAALLVLWFFFGRNNAPGNTPVVADSTGQTNGNAADSAINAAGGSVAALGAFIEQKLPDGTELNIPSHGVESQLLAFINDSNSPVTDTLWFNFDRLNFVTGSATLSPESSEQLGNVAEILRAYPNVNLKIGGYTDNTGNAAANKKLSQARADTVKADLVNRVIPGARLSAEGYGDAHPVADNSTAEGRAKNRRIAMRVTKK